MNNEIRKTENVETGKVKKAPYEKIKPETGISFNQIKEFWEQKLSSPIDISEKKKETTNTESAQVDVKNCPVENGNWDGERGNSTWRPDPDFVPLKQNEDNKSWGDIEKELHIDGIKFKDGEPNFNEISKGDAKIETFTLSRSDNFDQADIKLAEQRGCKPEEVEAWRKENKYTWHECKDMKTMQKVPSVVHNNISHRGGISEAKGEN